MKTRRSLVQLTSWILGHIDTCQREIDRQLLLRNVPLASDVSFPLIDMHNALATFMRSYCLSSLSGAYMANGCRVNVKATLRANLKTNEKIRGHRLALSFAINTQSPTKTGRGPWKPRDEPTWHDPNVIIQILHKARCSNATGVSDALSIGSRAIPHLTTTRNFLAHRNESTALKLRRLGQYYGVGRPADPLASVFAIRHGRPQTMVQDWLDDIFTIFSLFPR